MSLFLVLSLPLFFLLVLWLPWNPRKAPESVVLVGTFFKGALLFFPAFVTVLIVRRIFGFSYGGFLFYLSLLLRDHLAPILAALGCLLIMKSRLQVSGVEEDNFLGVFTFLAGFFAMENLADLVRSWGNWSAYVLFLLPILRLSTVFFIALVARKFYPWEGPDALMLCLAGAGLAVGLALPGFLFLVNRPLWAILLTVAPLLGAVVSFAMRFPRVVRA